jgi:putative nucleotidyltransferase with HDIG domain
VQTLAVELAVRLGMTDADDLRALSLAALLHDVGKLDIPDAILQKPGALTAAETAIMQSHANRGATRLTTLGLPSAVTTIVRHHHEHWDGSGYPWGLKGNEIPLGARIVAVADSFDALTSDRPYRAPLSAAAAAAQLSNPVEHVLDPTLVERASDVLA